MNGGILWWNPPLPTQHDGHEPCELLLETIRTGRVRERQVSDLTPWAFYKDMKDEDLKAIFAGLKTLKPVEHYVDNSMQPTACPQCGLRRRGAEQGRQVTTPSRQWDAVFVNGRFDAG